MLTNNADNIKSSSFNWMIENMLDLICQVSLEGTYEYLSLSHKTLLGYEPQALLHKSLFEHIHPDDVNMVRTSFVRGLTTGQFNQTKFRYRCANGEFLFLESQGRVVYDENSCVCRAVFVSRDISKTIKMENEIERLGQLRMVGEMAAGLAHEIRNPMTTVRGFLQVLGDKEELQPYREYFDLMIEELDRANDLISEFLSLSKDKAVKYSQQNLNILIHSLYPILAADAKMADQQIRLELGEIPNIYMDNNQIRQLILNLAHNGLESMEAGGDLTIKTAVVDENIVLSLEDHGHGIGAEVLEKIGTPFFTTKEQGTGLGLAICYSITARHQANIEIASSANGTIFSVIFQNPENPASKHYATGQKLIRCVS
jgi:two-component system, sporulation sensor kinase E